MRAAHHLQFQTDSPPNAHKPNTSRNRIYYSTYTAEVDSLTVFFFDMKTTPISDNTHN